jgi:hypothetical protein
MQLERIHPADIVECEINGRAFRADVKPREPRHLVIVLICRNISYPQVQARHVRRHWRLAGGYEAPRASLTSRADIARDRRGRNVSNWTLLSRGSAATPSCKWCAGLWSAAGRSQPAKATP